MLESIYKFGEVHKLADQIEIGDDRVQFKNIFENNNGGVALVAFKNGQALSEHLAPAEIMVCVVEGKVEFTMIDKPHTLNEGEFILVGEGVPHSVVAKANSKLMIVKVKTDKA